jgi:sec-independent protein translocase protein TatA
MGEFSIYHWILVALLVVLLFSGRKIPQVMRGLGEGIQEIRKAMGDSDKK